VATFTTRNRVRNLLGLASGVTVHDELIDALVEVSDQIIFDEIGLPSADGARVSTYTETLDVSGTGQNEIAVNYVPLISVVALTTGGSGGSLVDSDNYYFTEWGQVRLIPIGGFFPSGRQTVQITYTAGFSRVPNDLRHAATLVAVHMFNEGPHVGFQAERLATYNYKIANLGQGLYMPRIAQRILGKYKRLFARP